MIVNRKYGTEPSILHLCGALHHLNIGNYKGVKDAFYHDVTIITAISSDRKDRLRRYFGDNQPYLVGINEGKWENRLKLPIYYSLLQKVETPFALMLDNADVVVVRKELDEGVYQHKCLTQHMSKRNLPSFHINSGCVFGEKDFLIEWYAKTLDCDNFLTEWIKINVHPGATFSDELRLNYTARGMNIATDERRMLVQPPNYDEFYETDR